MFVGVTAAEDASSTRTIVLDTQFRFTALRTMLADGVQRIAILSDRRATADLIARGERLANAERARPPRSVLGTAGGDQLGLVAKYPLADVGEDTPLIAISASLDEATAAALEFIDNGAESIEVVAFAGGGIPGLVRSMLELADELARERSATER